ncbi:phage tail sheath C-terminal domain-containing protein [Bacillus tianshenii]|nr:phage tail sheath C-terminal domain-containing protein [Bacillus tianshenii]
MVGLPEINIEFKGKAVSAVKRSARGIVALILHDDTGSFETKVYTESTQVEGTDWTEENIDLIKVAFKANPAKVICERLDTTATDLAAGLTRLGSKRFNYLAIPSITTEQVPDVETWIKSKRESDKRSYKAVLPHADSDHEGIINFATSDIVVGEKTYTTEAYCVRIAGILAALPFTRSATYYELSEVDSIIESTDPNGDIDAGKLILINDGEKIKIGRGVNSLTTTTLNKTEDFKKIRVVEVMDLMSDDIRSTYDNYYVGKVNNIYDNQVLFFTSINAYFEGLEADEILDPNFDNRSGVNIEAQRLAWESIGIDTSEWSEQQVKENTFKSKVFAKANVKIVDAMEDLDFQIAM